MVGRSDAAEHQDLRAADGAGRQQHLAVGVDVVDLVLAQEADADGAPALHQDLHGAAVLRDVQVGSVAHLSSTVVFFFCFAFQLVLVT